MTDDLLAQFRSGAPLPEDPTAQRIYARATGPRRRITGRGAITVAVAAACLAGGGTALALAVTTPAHPTPRTGQHGPADGQTSTERSGTSTNCGIETKTYPQPPAGFDPTKATPAELQEYGFPPRPPGDASDPAVQAATASWLEAMRAWRTTDPAEPTCSDDTHPPSR